MRNMYKPWRRSQAQCCATIILLAISLLAHAQSMQVKGKVLASDNRTPLEGVNIVLKNTRSGATTDGAGEYQVEVRENFFSTYASDTLLFSHAGYRTLEIPINGRFRIDVLLEPLAAQLVEIVVTGTAAGRSPRLMSYAVGKINEELLHSAPATVLGPNLQGKVPGLRVNPVSGQPGQNAFFQIRSANAIANGQQPLIIVDGIFLANGSLADLNPDDVEKIEILKGSAGTSLYGSQAANGVIQIFTKRGKQLSVGETRVTYRGEVGVSQPVNRYDVNTLTNREIVKAEGPQPILGNPIPGGFFTQTLPNLQDYQQDVLFRNGALQSHNLNIQGRSDRTNFMLSAQRMQDEGILQRTTGYTRHAFRLNTDHQISNKLEMQANVAFSNSRQDLLEAASNGPSSYLASVLFLTPIFDLFTANKEDNSGSDWDIDNSGPGIINPVYYRNNVRQEVLRNRLLGNLTTHFYANDWLTLSYSATLDQSDNHFEQFVEKGYLGNVLPGLFGTQVTAGVQNSGGGGIHKSNRQGRYFTSRADAAVQKALLGFNTALRGSFLYEDLTWQFNEAIGENLAVAGLRSLDNARSNIDIASEAQEIVGYSGFLIGDADYQQKFIFSGLIRREGTSLFGVESRWANYYRASGAWRVTEDLKIKGIQQLKLRASVGTAGIRPAFEQRFETFELINGVPTKNTLGNDALRPVRSTEREIGINMSFLRAFDLEFNYVQIVSEDQILLVPLSGAAGFTGQWRNAGTISAIVYEAGLNTDFKKLFKIKIPDFRWNVYATFDRNRQTITRLDVPSYVTGPGIQQSSLFLIQQGASFGTMIGEVFATNLQQLEGQEGVNPNDYTINPVGYVVRKDQLGTDNEVPYKLRDANGNPIVQPIGDINPLFRMGFAHFLGYKGFQIYALFDWKKGGDVYNMTRHWLYRDLRHGEVSRFSDVSANFYGSNGLYNVLVPNNHFVEDGSFFMLREASVSYNFRGFSTNYFIRNLQLQLTGRNLFTKTRYSGFHPDVSAAPRDENTLTNRFQNALGSDTRTPNGDPTLFAVDAFNYPLARTITFSIQATF